MDMPKWLVNSLQTGFKLKDKRVIEECWKQWDLLLNYKKL